MQKKKSYKIIYTSGLTGFIGTNLKKYLLDKYDFILNFKRNNQVTIYTNKNTKTIKLTKKVFIKYEAKHFINLATYYNSHPKNYKEVKELVNSNILFIIKLINSFPSKKNLEIINICSAFQLVDFKFQNTYSLSKQMINNFLIDNNYSHKNIYLFDTFGKNDTRNKVTDVFIKKILNNQKINIGSNKVRINLSNVNNICLSLVNAIKKPNGNYCIKSKNTIFLEDLAKLIMKKTKKIVKIEKKDYVLCYFDKIKYFPKNIFIKKNQKKLENEILERINEIKQTHSF